MSVNGITSNPAAAYEYQATNTKQNENQTDETKKSTAEGSGVVYEPSKVPPKYKPDTETINRLLAEAEERKNQFMELVRQMLMDQGHAVGKADSIWNLLREGKLNVDAATRDQAIEDISEDGYWGVKKTSQRILDFAVALTGGNPSKIDEMQAAYEKGYKMAEKAWGGELPELCKKTYDAVLAGFQKMREDAGLVAPTS